MSARTIKTVYYHKHQGIKTTLSSNANRAVATCVLHMQINHYGAGGAEVYDVETGALHASIRRSLTGIITIVYMRDPALFETRYALGHLIGL